MGAGPANQRNAGVGAGLAPQPAPPNLPILLGRGQAPLCKVPGCRNSAREGKNGWKCNLKCGQGTFIRHVWPGTDKYKDLEAQITTKFNQRQIAMIYKVHDYHGSLEKGHEAYYKSLGNTPVYKKGRSPGNQQRRFHATFLACNFNGVLCNNAQCAVCSIIKNGFDLNKIKRGSFGSGHYSSSSPAKAYGYGNQKAMFVVNVACGVVDISQSSGSLQAGHHSRVAQFPGMDELIVFKNEAMVPRYLIIWK